MVYHHDDYDVQKNDVSNISSRSKSQYTKTSNTRSNLKYITSNNNLNPNSDHENKIKHDEQLQEVLALYDKHFLEYSISEFKVGKNKKSYVNVDFSKLDNLDFETNKQKVQDFLVEIQEEEEASINEEKTKTPLKSIIKEDIQLI